MAKQTVHSLLLLHLALRIGSGRCEKKVAVVPGPVGARGAARHRGPRESRGTAGACRASGASGGSAGAAQQAFECGCGGRQRWSQEGQAGMEDSALFYLINKKTPKKPNATATIPKISYR